MAFFKLFRNFILIFSASFVFSFAHGQTINDAELPFKYLNQYFAYDIKDEEFKVTINDRVFEIDEFIVTAVDQGYTIKLNEELAKFFEGGKIFVRPKQVQMQEQLNLVFEPAIVSPLTEYNLTAKRKINLKNMTDVCLEKSSKFTTITICKSLLDNSKTDEKVRVVADDASLGLSGQVILQESQRRSQFLISFPNQDTFKMETERRKVYPATIEKKTNSDKVEIRFVDLVDQTVAWQDTVTIQQRYVEFRMDSILNVRQDILFSDPEIFSKPISQQLIDRAKVTVAAKNRLSFLPQIGVVQLSGESFDINFKLRSPMSLGMLVGYYRYLNPSWNWLLEMNATSTRIALSGTDLILEGGNANRYQILTGFEHDLSARWETQISIGFRNDIFPTAINVTEGIRLNQGTNDFIEGRLQWNAFENDNIEFLFPVKYRIFPPGQAGSVEAKTGTGYEYGAVARAKTKWGRIKAGITSGARNQKYDDVDLKEIYYFVNIGALYLF